MDYDKLVKEVDARIPKEYRENPVKDKLFGHRDYATFNHLEERLKGKVPIDYRVHYLNEDKTCWLSRKGEMYIPEMLVRINMDKDYELLAPLFICVFLFDYRDCLLSKKIISPNDYRTCFKRAKDDLCKKHYAPDGRWSELLISEEYYRTVKNYKNGEPVKSEEQFAEMIMETVLAEMKGIEYEYWHYSQKDAERILGNYFRTKNGTRIVKNNLGTFKTIFDIVRPEEPKDTSKNNRPFYRVESINRKGVTTSGCMSVVWALLSNVAKVSPLDLDERKLTMLQGSSLEYDTLFSILAALGCVPKPDVYMNNRDNYCLYDERFYRFNTYKAFSTLDSLMEEMLDGEYSLILKEFRVDNTDILYEDDYQIVISKDAYEKYNDGCSYKYIKDLVPDSTELLPGKKEYKAESKEQLEKLRLRDSFRTPIMLCGDDTLEILRFLIENCMGELFERLARAVVYGDYGIVMSIFDIVVKDPKLKHIKSKREDFNVSAMVFFNPDIYFEDLNIGKEESFGIYRSMCDKNNWLHDAFLSISTKEQKELYLDSLGVQLKDEIKKLSSNS